jgi:hypothetical protein
VELPHVEVLPEGLLGAGAELADLVGSACLLLDKHGKTELEGMPASANLVAAYHHFRLTGLREDNRIRSRKKNQHRVTGRRIVRWPRPRVEDGDGRLLRLDLHLARFYLVALDCCKRMHGDIERNAGLHLDYAVIELYARRPEKGVGAAHGMAGDVHPGVLMRGCHFVPYLAGIDDALGFNLCEAARSE